MKQSVDEIAKILNLSVTTVRLVINNKADKYRISQKTQAKVRDYIEKYGYSLDYTARSLKLKKSETLALVIPHLSNSFFSTLAEKLELASLKLGFQLIISSTYDDFNNEKRLINHFIERNVDGIFIVPSVKEAYLDYMQFIDKPIVILDRDFGFERYPTIVSDNFAGGKELAEKMLNTDIPHLYFFACNSELPTIAERIKGYQQSLLTIGYDPNAWLITGKRNTLEEGYSLFSKFIKRHGDFPQAFITSSLPVLEGSIHAIKQHVGYMPGTIKIGTFDEHSMLNFLSNSVWSIKQDEEIWAQQAMNQMFAQLNNETTTLKNIIPIKLISRPHKY